MLNRPLLIILGVLVLTNLATVWVAAQALKAEGKALAQVKERDEALEQAAADYLALDTVRLNEHAQLAQRERERRRAAQEAREWERAYRDAMAKGSETYQECRAVALPAPITERLRARTNPVPHADRDGAGIAHP